MLVPSSMLLASPAQAQASDSSTPTSTSKPTLQIINGGTHDIPLKAIKNNDGKIDIQDDFEIEPQNVVSIGQPNNDFHVIPSDGSIFAVKITDEQRQTKNVQFSKTDGRVTPVLASKAYMLDIVVEMDNGDKYLYETVLAVLEPGQTLNQVNTQNIIQNFVTRTSSSNSHTTVVFRDNDDDNDDDNGEESSICYFDPSDPECDQLPGGGCREGFHFNEGERSRTRRSMP